MLNTSQKTVLPACFLFFLMSLIIVSSATGSERFVLFPCSITGYAFDDTNDNGQLDTREAGLENISVTLSKMVFMFVFLPVGPNVNSIEPAACIREIDSASDEMLDSLSSDNRSSLFMSRSNVFMFFSFVPVRIGSTLTDENGYYSFENLRSGLYKIEALQSTGTLKRAYRKVGLINNTKTAHFAFEAVQTQPNITFTADPDTITEGNASTLRWTVENADSVTIDNGIGPVDTVSGSLEVYPVQTTTYTLTATYGTEQYTRAVTVTVTPLQPVPAVEVKAMIHVDPQSIQKGDSCILTWSAENAQDIAIDQGTNQIITVSDSGIMKIYPKETTTYTIIATGYDGSAAKDNATVVVYEAEGQYASGTKPEDEGDADTGDNGTGEDAAGTTEGGTGGTEVTGDKDDPTLVTLDSFGAAKSGDTVHISWSTSAEVNTIGFNIYYASCLTGEYVRANDSIIIARGGPVESAAYDYVHILDTGVQSSGFYYLLEEIDRSGNASWHGPVKAQ